MGRTQYGFRSICSKITDAPEHSSKDLPGVPTRESSSTVPLFLYRQPILSKCIARGRSSPPFPFTIGQGADLQPPVFLKRRPLLSQFVLAPQPAGVENRHDSPVCSVPRGGLFTKTNCLLVLTGCTGLQPARYRYRRRPPPQGAVPRANTHYSKCMKPSVPYNSVGPTKIEIFNVPRSPAHKQRTRGWCRSEFILFTVIQPWSPAELTAVYRGEPR